MPPQQGRMALGGPSEMSAELKEGWKERKKRLKEMVKGKKVRKGKKKRLERKEEVLQEEEARDGKGREGQVSPLCFWIFHFCPCSLPASTVSPGASQGPRLLGPSVWLHLGKAVREALHLPGQHAPWPVSPALVLGVSPRRLQLLAPGLRALQGGEAKARGTPAATGLCSGRPSPICTKAS